LAVLTVGWRLQPVKHKADSKNKMIVPFFIIALSLAHFAALSA
jgi:hypothetical protein